MPPPLSNGGDGTERQKHVAEMKSFSCSFETRDPKDAVENIRCPSFVEYCAPVIITTTVSDSSSEEF